MRVVEGSSAAEFLARVEPYLSASPVENNVLLGVISSIAPGSAALLLSVEDAGSIALVAVQTPPRVLLIGRGSKEAVRKLVDHLVVARPDLPGVNGPKETVDAFAAAWSDRTGRVVSPRRFDILYALRAVVAPRAVSGRLRQAKEADEARLADWSLAFQEEVGVSVGIGNDARPFVRAKREAGQLFVWDDAGAVSMAAWAARTAAVVRVNYVFTPPERRNQGYASACVGELTRRLLETSERCILYADAANAASNAVYRKLGYEAVKEFAQYDFAPA